MARRWYYKVPLINCMPFFMPAAFWLCCCRHHHHHGCMCTRYHSFKKANYTNYISKTIFVNGRNKHAYKRWNIERATDTANANAQTRHTVYSLQVFYNTQYSQFQIDQIHIAINTKNGVGYAHTFLLAAIWSKAKWSSNIFYTAQAFAFAVSTHSKSPTIFAALIVLQFVDGLKRWCC